LVPLNAAIAHPFEGADVLWQQGLWIVEELFDDGGIATGGGLQNAELTKKSVPDYPPTSAAMRRR
jgi:hypothetical protein